MASFPDTIVGRAKVFKGLAALSVAWILLVFALIHFGVLGLTSVDEKKFGLNIIGDYLAGALAPLVLFWAMFAYWAQVKQLELNTAALNAQLDEFKESVSEQKTSQCIKSFLVRH